MLREGGTQPAVVDIQRCAIIRAGAGAGDMPSLKRVVQAWLPGNTMDKAEQCSDWARRPLTEAQLLCEFCSQYSCTPSASLSNMLDSSQSQTPRWTPRS